SVEELFVGKTAFNHHAIVFIFNKGQMIVMFNKLGQYKGCYFSAFEFFSLRYQFNIIMFFGGYQCIILMNMLNAIKYKCTGIYYNTIGMCEQEGPFVRCIKTFYIEGRIAFGKTQLLRQ